MKPVKILSACLMAAMGLVMMISIERSDAVALPLAIRAGVLAAPGLVLAGNLPEALCSLCRR